MSVSRIVSERELAEQREYSLKVRDIVRRKEETGKRLKAFVDTFGCQQNESDTEHLRGMILEMGYTLTADEQEADLILLNTCAVREHAELRVFGNVGGYSHIKKKNPELIIGLCGCMMQEETVRAKVKKSYPYVDLVFGTHSIYRFPELLYRKLSGHRRVFDELDAEDPGRIVEGLPTHRDRQGGKAWLSIMYGCNNFCTYCIVPYVRGRERSRTFAEIEKEFDMLLQSGYKDITLLGQNVNSYGKDLDEKMDFADLLGKLAEKDGDFRLRFMTSHPKDATEKLFRTMAEHEKISHHLHLPFQSGSDKVLRDMNRRYTKEHYLDLVRMARELMPDIALTSDVIVGFPTETEEDFNETLDLIEKARFHALFTFLYSKRPGTPAAKMENVATKEERQRRFEKLLDVQNRISLELHREYVGKTYRVLIDGENEDPKYDLTARTDTERLVHLNGDLSLIGSFADVKIVRSSTWALFGELVKE